MAAIRGGDTRQLNLRLLHFDAVDLAGIHRLGQSDRVMVPGPQPKSSKRKPTLRRGQQSARVGLGIGAVEQLQELRAVPHRVTANCGSCSSSDRYSGAGARCCAGIFTRESILHDVLTKRRDLCGGHPGKAMTKSVMKHRKSSCDVLR